MRLSGFLVFAGIVLCGSTAAQASTIKVFCPTEARGTVSHNGDAAFWATPQSSRVLNVSIERIGGHVALACHYTMFGGDYIIWREPPATNPNCEVRAGIPDKFYCAS